MAGLLHDRLWPHDLIGTGRRFLQHAVFDAQLPGFRITSLSVGPSASGICANVVNQTCTSSFDILNFGATTEKNLVRIFQNVFCRCFEKLVCCNTGIRSLIQILLVARA